MSLNFVNINGTPINPDALKKAAPRRAPIKDAPSEYHKGWRVEGHPPGALELAKEAQDNRVRRWLIMDEKQRKEAGLTGAREPKPFCEKTWRDSTKKKVVRSKPYEVESAAKQCAELAIKSGWLDVVVVAIQKSAAQAA